MWGMNCDRFFFGNTGPKLQYYWGKVAKVRSNDGDVDVTQIVVSCLRKQTVANDPSFWN